MHKSIIVLLGLLVILLPIGTSNMNISNANAIADFDKGDRKQTSVSSLKCNNINVNVNGLELDIFSPFLANSGLAAEAAEDNTDPSSFAGSNGDSSVPEFNDFRFICINKNNNTVIEEQEPLPPSPPSPPEPTTAILTIKKQVFGCTVTGDLMDCTELQNNSTAQWLDCNTNPTINNTRFCLSLPESIFDIEVNASNTQQIQQFEGSEEGTTIEKLLPGTYIVNEIKHDSAFEQLAEAPEAEADCISAGFTDGGTLGTTVGVGYGIICFEYDNEQGNNCSTITLAAGEERTCTVKNYIRLASQS